MSNLLEQAIIDATALREVALKSAEANLIEKYSKEFKQSVEKLLEQEAASLEDDAAQMPPDADSATGMEATTLGADTELEDDKEEAFEDVPSSFLDGDGEEMVVINFDQLKKEIKGALGSSSPMLATPETPVAPETPAPEAMMESVEENEELDEAYGAGAKDVDSDALGFKNEEEELEEEYEVEEDVLVSPSKKQKRIKAGLSAEEFEEEVSLEEEMSEEEKTAQLKAAKQEEEAAKARQNVAKITQQRVAREPVVKTERTPMSEDIEISEEELNELMEELKVDINIDNLSDGHMGTTVTQKREQRNLEFAAARDYKAVEQREEEKKAMSDLKAKLEEALDVGSSLVEENEDLKSKLLEMEENLLSLKENVEKLSISNAKLLYTNKVLGNVSLNERQKEQIVENISKSTSVLEARTIYNTLQSTVSGISSKKPKESLSEALIRGNSPFITRKKEETDIPFAERMKKLAGIT